MTTLTQEILLKKYINFCQNNDLNANIPPDEQYDIPPHKQRWIDSLIHKMERSLFCKGKSIDVDAMLDDTILATNKELLTLAVEHNIITKQTEKKTPSPQLDTPVKQEKTVKQPHCKKYQQMMLILN